MKLGLSMIVQQQESAANALWMRLSPVSRRVLLAEARGDIGALPFKRIASVLAQESGREVAS